MRLSIIEDLKKYSYIKKVERRSNIIYLFYDVEGKEKCRKFPLRITVGQLQEILKEIRKESGVNYYGKPETGQCFVI